MQNILGIFDILLNTNWVSKYKDSWEQGSQVNPKAQEKYLGQNIGHEINILRWINVFFQPDLESHFS